MIIISLLNHLDVLNVISLSDTQQTMVDKVQKGSKKRSSLFTFFFQMSILGLHLIDFIQKNKHI